jgi:2-dehydropantoate 2-reductase
LLGGLHGVPTPVNELLERLALQAASKGSPPGSMRLEDLSEMAGMPSGG